VSLRLIVLGRQGAGKGTQCVRLSERYDIPHISTGDMLRAAVQAGTELGQMAKSIMDAGDLVPDEVMNGIVSERLGEADAATGFLLDGFPRSDVQAAWLNTALEPGGIDLVVSLEVPDGVVIERMLARGRADDTEAAIRRRLDLYEAETAPLMGFYRDLGKVVSVNGHGEEDEVEKRLAEVIDAHLTC
jgi:adenylate kinase